MNFTHEEFELYVKTRTAYLRWSLFIGVLLIIYVIIAFADVVKVEAAMTILQTFIILSFGGMGVGFYCGDAFGKQAVMIHRQKSKEDEYERRNKCILWSVPTDN